MTVPEMKSSAYPIIKQNVADQNTGSRLQCFKVTSDALG